jgi:hypothetical protein
MRRLSERFQRIAFHHYSGSLGSRTVLTPREAETIAKGCNAVVGAAADSGGAASWLPSEMVQIERLGTPTVALTASGFEHIFRQSAVAFGSAAIPMVVLPKIFNGTAHPEIEQMVDDAMDGIIAALTHQAPGRPDEPEATSTSGAEVISIEGLSAWDILDNFNETFLRHDWGDGLPLLPPTQHAVEQMLKGSTKDSQDVIAVLEPAFGLATVEKIAVNAVMAGCKPSHMPVLIAAVRAIADPLFMLRDAAVATGARAPLFLINGPIRDRLKINSGTCAMGPGAISRANTVIGRAMRLVIMNVAGVYPGKTDISTMGSPSKYSLCVAENEEASPWEPYHVELGFDRHASTVTAKSVFGMTETQELKSSTTAERLANLGARAAVTVGKRTCWIHGGNTNPENGLESQPQNMWLICPHHAEVMAKAGWSKHDVRRYLYDHAVVPVSDVLNFFDAHTDDRGDWTKNTHLQWLEKYPDLLVPVVASPHDFRIAVVGGPGSRGMYFWGNEMAVTKLIEE